MNNLLSLQLFSLIVALLFGTSNADAQNCNVTATATPATLPCGGGTVTLTANGTGGVTFAMDNDFNGGTAGPGWTVSPAGQFNNPCGGGVDGTTYMWMGNTTAAPRTLETAPLNVSCGGTICFDMMYAAQGGAAPCEGPDLANEGVYLEYSIDGGATWITIQYWDPNGGNDPQMTSWNNYCFPIPLAAETNNTLFRWYQGGSSGTCCDHWGIDNVTITAQNCLPYYYDWLHIPGSPDNPSIVENVNTTTTFDVIYTNGVNDTCYASVTVTVLGMGAPTVVVTDETCLGDSDGTITVTPNGGTAPYTYDIAGPVNQSNGTGIFTNLPPGNYTVTVTDNAACTVNVNVVVNPGANCCPMTVDPITWTNVDCNGACNGTATANQTGGMGVLAYVWYDAGMVPIGQTTQTATGLCAGTYNVEITDATPCTVTAQVVITEPAALALTPSNTNVTCNGGCDGTATVDPAGGVSPYSYNWLDAGLAPIGQTTQTATGLCAGTYNVDVTDANNCTTQIQIVVTEPTAVTFTTATTDATCGVCDGTITINANGGIGGYQYSCDGGMTWQASNVCVNMCSATHNIVVEDASGCQATGTATVNPLAGPTVDSTNFTDPLCNGACDGAITIYATGAVGYSIDNGVTFVANNTFTNLCAGTYNVVVDNGSACFDYDQVTLTDPPVLSYSAAITNLLCYQDSVGVGQINITATGGTAPYDYNIGYGVQTSNVFNDVGANTYTITVTDANGCVVTGVETVTEPPLLTMAFSAFDAICAGACDGYAITIPGGGTSPYNFAWVGSNSTSPTANNLCAGLYSLTITDANGCTIDTVDFPINEPAPMTIAGVTITDELCSGDCSGVIDVNAPGAVLYSIDNWGTSQPGNIFNNICAGNYTVYVEDASGCQASMPVVVGTQSPVSISVSNDTTICIGGTATLTGLASGGVGGFNYTWDDVNNTAAATLVAPDTAAIYGVYALDANGCQTPTVYVNVTVHPPLNVTALSDQSICPGSSATISAVVTGGDGGPYNYDWDDGNGWIANGQFQTVSPSTTTSYTVTVTDGCETPSANDQITITVNPIPVVNFVADNVAGCTPVDVRFVNTTDPAMVGNNCLWSFGDGTFASDCDTVYHTYTNPGCYDVSLTVYSPDNCLGDTTFAQMICVYPYPVADFSFGPQPTSVLEPTIYFSNSSIGAIEYNWLFDVLDSSTEQDPSYTFPADEEGTYNVCLIAESANGCIDTTCQTVVIDGQFLIYVPNAFTPDGDGVNDFFGPVIQGHDIFDYAMFIYDRWGELVFETHHELLQWGGNIKGSSEVGKQDVYVWKVVATDKYTGKEKEYVGHVTLLR